MTETIHFQTVKEQLSHLPGDVLLSIATNDSAPFRNKKAAVELMVEHGYAHANAPAISHILAEVKADQEAKAEVVDILEQATEIPMEKPKHTGASKASVTTETL